ncbi:hypothetical protein B0J11DRAFT_549921 [Dendryphion nanum]|uniref:Pyridoxamine 5'-phosphate oxidase putative domain-containing protein n=1 Tax=Dendryphion nanum TaxID=256645 RepID=A0A9P9DY48_9PLEO|nr:hypothetical protein B0J11DRAFT_549921 [Dendryphion nanum]
MGVYYETIPPSLQTWILDQKMLWVATAPLSSTGHINLSPKGGQHFGILSPTQFYFLDLTGSGVETTAHLHEPQNGRIVIMFQAFEGAPKIIRLWGHGRAIENGTAEFEIFVRENKVKIIPGARSVVLVDIEQVGSSCGFSVPFYEFKGWRETLNEFFEKKEKKFESGMEGESMDRYWAYKSQLSVDGLPGMKRGVDFADKHGVAPLKKFVGGVGSNKRVRGGAREEITVLHLALVALLALVIGVVGTLTVVSPEVVGKVQRKEYWG